MEPTKQERFMQVYAPVHDRLQRYCKTRTYGKFHIEDLMQDTLLIAFDKFESLKSKDAFLHFLFGTAARLLANHQKKKKPEYVDNFSDKFEYIKSNEIDIEKQLEIDFLYEQLEKLDSVTRECIILFEVSGFSIKEIMVILNLGESAVKQRLSRGRKQLIVQMNSLEEKLG
jgi:RNA polymerase sigma-70 factor (ECF subfamily)